MATIKRKGFMFMEYGPDHTIGDWKPEWRPVWKWYRPDNDKDLVYIGEQTIAFEVPDDFDPRPGQIAALEEEKRAITAAFQKRVTEINGQIANLQAITFDGAAA